MRDSAPRDRKLGDEWREWDGSFIDPGEIRAGNRLFLLLLLAAILLLIGACFLLLYMISPRLAQYSARLPHLIYLVLIAASILAFLWFGAVLLILKTKSSRFCFCLGNKFFFEISDLATRLGRRIGLSRDRVGHSFIKVSNAIAIASLRAKLERKVLILLPRCLSPQSRKRVLEICARYPVAVRTVAGGEAAREHVKQLAPDAVIGIACERDLVSGIRDVAARIPVFGIPNIRPEGPCKGTYIDYGDLEETLRFVFG
jgi:hypothetical protein